MKKRSHFHHMALFLISPFVGVYYAVLLPGKLLQLALAQRQKGKGGKDATS